MQKYYVPHKSCKPVVVGWSSCEQSFILSASVFTSTEFPPTYK